MEFYETLARRHSVRSFTDKPVEKDKLTRILEAANISPSAGNLQARRIYVVRADEAKEELMLAAFDQEAVLHAPLVLVFTALQQESASEYGERGSEIYSTQDATIAAAYAQLAATAEGLGSVWVGAFDPLEVSRIVKAGEYEVPVAILPIGYPAESPVASGRKALKELVREVGE